VPAVREPVIETGDALIARLRAAGYPDAKGDPVDALADAKAGTIEIEFRLRPGLRATFGKLAVSGLGETKEAFIDKLRPGRKASASRRNASTNFAAASPKPDFSPPRLSSSTQRRLSTDRRKRPAMSSSTSRSVSAARSPSARLRPPAMATASMRNGSFATGAAGRHARNHGSDRDPATPHRRVLSPAARRQVRPYPQARDRDRGFRDRRFRPVRRQTSRRRSRNNSRHACADRSGSKRASRAFSTHRPAPPRQAVAMSTSSQAWARPSMSASRTSSTR